MAAVVAALLALGLVTYFVLQPGAVPFGGPNGGSVVPAGIAGRWSGQLALDLDQLPAELRPILAANAGNFRLPLEVECSPDGKVRMGALGQLTDYAAEARLVGTVVDGTDFADGVTLTEYHSDGDSISFTLHQRSRGERGIYAGRVGIEVPAVGPTDKIVVLALRQRGDGIDAAMIMTDRLKDNIPVHLNGPLMRVGD